MTSTSMLALLGALGLVAATGLAPKAAFAADLGGDEKSDEDLLKKLVEGDGPLTIHGITLYGTIDAGYSNLTHGTKPSDFATTTEPFLIQKFSNGSSSGLVQSPLEQSKLGVKGTEDLGLGWAAVFKLETGFDPLTGNLIDGLRSITVDNGVSITAPNYVEQGDSSRAGQFFESAAWGGVSHKVYGTLTYGRQNAILLDALQAADPMGGAYAFSPIGYSGLLGGGGGDTQDARLDNSIRYANTIGPVRFGGEYQFATNSDGGEGYQFGLGFDYKGFSLDGVYANKTGGISASSLSGPEVGTLAGLGLSSDKTVDATLSDNQTYAITARYDGGQWKLFGGYENISQGNSSNPQGIASATAIGGVFQDIGGYNILTVVNNKYVTDRVTQMEWVGGKFFLTPKLSATAAYYHISQGDYQTTNSKGVVVGCTGTGTGASGNCAGNEDAVSFLLDYQWTKRLDVYGGAMYSKVNDGLSSGFLNTDNTAVTAGARVKF